jgi:hypothetical protein
MTTTRPRRFVIAVAPGPLAWLAEALNRAFRCPAEPFAAQDVLIERLTGPR